MGYWTVTVFMRHWETEIVKAPDVPSKLEEGWIFIAVDPDDLVTWYVHRDLAEQLLRPSA